ncbi:hypothetical protein SAMN06265221_11066 [Paracoccus laeviglucosivorans]|uniref:Uncharacterized protein n=1 Tax=Paracoccus laeviglucosivorans TaxID=1197861 RepID=A0A521DX72_9RHOB|nr:hypothetical protein SAMN06265221_11066 [Paracoccus laeviglucosivorans]
MAGPDFIELLPAILAAPVVLFNLPLALILIA